MARGSQFSIKSSLSSARFIRQCRGTTPKSSISNQTLCQAPHEKARSDPEKRQIKSNSIPYRYEYPLVLEGCTIHPDFTILRKEDRREFYLEHFGMLDETEYRNNALARILLYERNNLFPGESLIITAETVRRPLNSADVKRVINHYFTRNM